MEQLAKQHQTLAKNSTDCRVEVNKYRNVIFGLLNHLKEAGVEIIEADNHTVLGDRNAPLQGQIVVHDASFYQDVVKGGSIGAAEAFLDAKWTSPDLTRLVQVFARN
ncbi:hypothetical protein TUM4644_17500 [Shewanella colwelliana]|uniref:hypothetical protein n=1 Tax=Shewanella colwelliana TaxID=23 RepID=UPI001BC20A09|nr:hypothetical protein [Shewanella colwelliana]GIU23693.1 hypothetical protein TUM4644_17500 [Shewanella colwelliana]